MSIKLTATLCAVTVLTSSCASIVSKSTYPVSITSSEKGQKFTVYKDNFAVTSGKTPETVSLDASNGYFQPASYTVKFEGDSTSRVPLKADIDPWYIFGNIAFGGLIGWIVVDPLTGAMWKLPKSVGNGAMSDMDTPEEDKDATTSSLSGQQTTVISLHDVPESYRDKLVPIAN